VSVWSSGRMVKGMERLRKLGERPTQVSLRPRRISYKVTRNTDRFLPRLPRISLVFSCFYSEEIVKQFSIHTECNQPIVKHLPA
jgi:hypothetical protein